jgi:N-terminal domain of anti-restriction factor ArdC
MATDNSKSKALLDRITESIASLAAITDTVRQSEMFKSWLLTMSRFHSYSWNNQMLIYIQRPNATRVAGFHAWKAVGRSVKKGAKGIAILAPRIRKREVQSITGETETVNSVQGYLNVHVFDVADTEGADLPDLHYRATGGGETILPRLEHAARTLGIKLEYREHTGMPLGWSEGGKIVVRSTLSEAEKCGTVAHEIGHEVLHWRNNRRAELSVEQRELEAESVSYAVLAQLGIEQPSGEYLASWRADAKSITAAMHTIRDAVHEILAAVESYAEDDAVGLAA